jgi:ADP-ribose pyrophosphatase
MEYQLLNRKIIYSGRVFDVAVHEYRLPDGRTQNYDVVEHHGAVTVVPIDDEGMIHFVRQFRVAAQVNLLELPAGVLHEGEDPREGASREVREEIGQAAAQLTYLGTFYMVPGYSSEKMIVYLATGLTPDPLPMDDDEFLQIERISVQRALEMARSGEILDGKTLGALLLAEKYL